ncbi:hypothetical protein Taro_002201 [Colocasia esculenta]|uniref:GDSL esterase/lipase APG n=1 Tax=Colocasia esculenta TaxID=4460 RepID=A0A843TC44_COLES|nr:hypothetical protein [Colocasia esculenta]
MATLVKRLMVERGRWAAALVGSPPLFFLVALLMAAVLAPAADGQPLVPAVIVFGDSVADSGNNNGRLTIFKADFPPYGRDFPGHTPTGRFCNGKLVTDITVETLGFAAYPPAYLGPNATGKNLLIGANFASGASGYLGSTAILYVRAGFEFETYSSWYKNAVSLKQQLSYYKEYQQKVEKIAGNKTTSDSIFSGGVHILSAGTSDFLQNYYINPVYYLIYTPAQFADLLVGSFTSFVQDLYRLGARKIGVASLPPMGCLPAAITLFGKGGNECVKRLNGDALVFNRKLNATAGQLKKKLAGLKLVVLDIYKPLLDLVDNPAGNGFFEARKACCGTGTIETSLLCNAKSPGTCKNATGYVFWDSVHPSEAANQVLANALLVQAIDLLS